MNTTSSRLEQHALTAVAIVLALGCLLVMRPFFSSILWALILALATWPALTWLERRTGMSRVTSSALLTALFLLAFVVPLVALSLNLADNVGELTAQAKRIAELVQDPALPERLKTTPYVGPWLAERWDPLLKDQARLIALAQRILTPVAEWLLVGGGFLGSAILQFLISIFLLYFIYRHGEMFVERLEVGTTKIGGERSRHLLRVAGSTLRGSIYGIVGTAVAQGFLAGVGFLIAGVPAPLLLGTLTFILSPVPVGPPLLWISGAVWLFVNDMPGWAIFLALWGALIVSSVDNFLKPYLISRESNLPLVVILIGVMGGALAFGALGVFLGPALLAVGFTVLKEWSETTRRGTETTAVAAAAVSSIQSEVDPEQTA